MTTVSSRPGKRRSRRDEASRLTRQLSLALPERAWAPSHGGARPGAGRPRVKEKERGYLLHCARPSHRKGDPVHVTLRVGKGIPSLRRQSMERVVKLALL